MSSGGSHNKKQTTLFSFFSKKQFGTSIVDCHGNNKASAGDHDEHVEEDFQFGDAGGGKAAPLAVGALKGSGSRTQHAVGQIKKVKGAAPPTDGPLPRQKKRRRIAIESDSEEDEKHLDSSNGDTIDLMTKDEKDEDCEDLSALKAKFGIKSKKRRVESHNEPDTSTPISRKSRKTTAGISEMTKSFLNSFHAEESVSQASLNMEDSISSAVVSSERSQTEHLNLDFLKPGNIRDANKKRPSDPDYDPRTLYVPDSYYKTATPGLQQWWTIKSQHYDTILFFKVGKFYEMYHMDAVVCVKELNLSFMKGGFAHCGFPEIAYSRFADQLVQRGYNVARVEQTETPQQLEERKKATPSSKQKPKVVRREICQITTPGTDTGIGSSESSAADSDEKGIAEGTFASHSHSRYLLALCERVREEMNCGVSEASTYGVCFVDAATGKFQLGQFTDDFQRSLLRTLLAHYPPVQVLYERGRVSAETRAVFRTALAGQVIKEGLAPKTQFWTAKQTLEEISQSDYFGSKNSTPVECWPDTLLRLLNESDPVRHTPGKNSELCLMSLGAVIWYLRMCLIDTDLLSMKQFFSYVPNQGRKEDWLGQKMILDGLTLRNLDIVPREGSSSEDTWRGTLLDRLDYCSTPFGKRLLRQWICAPLCDPVGIRCRQEAVKELLHSHAGFLEKAGEKLRRMPDLERLLQRIHTLGSANRSQSHPDGRAVMFETDRHNKRKIAELLSTLSGLRAAVELQGLFHSEVGDFQSALLNECLSSGEKGLFPEIVIHLQQVEQSFDAEKAKKCGQMVPEPGFVEKYDRGIQKVKRVKEELENYLKRQKKHFSSSNISYTGTGRNRFQLEIPDSAAKKVTSDYEVVSQRKGFKRYMTREIECMFAELQGAEEERETALKDNMRYIFELFDQNYAKWRQAVECVAVFDVLLSFTIYARSLEGEMCLPEIETETGNGQSYIDIQDGVHPCFAGCLASGNYIPNSTAIGTADEPGSVMLITGPNMGGKSTVMRQVSLIVIVAQLGSYVPAKKCRLSPVDRIFTRLGANDRITAGQSTFCVELSETKVILRDASRHSLVVLDELGRGTSTHDGTAIAFAVLEDLTERVGCRTLFSTHYHSLVEDFRRSRSVQLRHMACMVENENEEDPTEETITFLYKLLQGPCPKSYGFHAAKLAGIPLEVIRNAHLKSKTLDCQISPAEATFQKLKRAASEALSDSDLINRVKSIVI